MKSTDANGFHRPEEPLRHVKRYIAKELSKYPIYKELIKAAYEQLEELQAKSLRAAPGGEFVGGSGVGDPVGNIAIQIASIEHNINHLLWRVRRTEQGLEYFRNNPEILELIRQKYFVCHNLTNEQLMDSLGYSYSSKKRYYKNVNQVVEVFGMIYGELIS